MRSDPRLAIGRAAAPDPPGAGPLWPIRLIQLQLSITYLVNVVNAWAKTTPEYLSGGVLVALARQPNFRVDLSDGFLYLGAALGIGFHLALQLVIEIGWLDWACLFLYLAFLLPFDAAARGGVSSSSPSMPARR